MYNDVIGLGKQQIVTDKYKNQIKAYVFREVFAEVKSISQSEYYTAAQSGIKPAYKFVLADYYDYDDEDIVKYCGRKIQWYHLSCDKNVPKQLTA